MSSVEYTSVATLSRIPSPSTHKFNPSYIAHAEERAEIAGQEGLYVGELSDLIQHYRRERARLQSAIRNVRTQFNAIAYVSRLPDEILATIFEAYVADHWERYYPLDNSEQHSTHHTPYEWIKNILHVCRQWRRLALVTPQLWTCIAYDRLYKDWHLDFHLEHAGNLLLSLRNDGALVQRRQDAEFWPSPEESEDSDSSAAEDLAFIRANMLKRALGQFSRIGTLALTVTGATEDLLRELGGSGGDGMDAPSMKNLLLDLSEKYLDRSSPLLHVNMPNLMSLVLIEGPLELMQRLSCSSLTHLTTIFEHDVLASDLLAVLENLPALRKLIVQPITAETSHGRLVVLQTRRAVSLPFLDLLRIEGTATGVTQFLCQLVLPVNTQIQMCVKDRFPASLLASVMPTILWSTAARVTNELSPTERIHWRRPHTIVLELGGPRAGIFGAECTTMSVYFWYTSTPALVSLEGVDSIEDNGPGSSPGSSWNQSQSIKLLLACYQDPSTLQEQLEVLDTSQVLTLTLKHVDLFNTDGDTEWHRVLRRPAFLKLETLCIMDGELVTNVLETLIVLAKAAPVITNPNTNCGSSTQAQYTKYLPLPSLKHLILRSIRFKPATRDQLDTASGILALLRQCVELGYKWRSLQLVFSTYLIKPLDTTTLATFQDTLSTIGIADAVEVTR